MVPFYSEADITDALLKDTKLITKNPDEEWAQWTRAEVEGFFGIPDIVIGLAKKKKHGGTIVRTYAFEMKRENWKRGLMQAYRYTSFANYSFVVMDAFYVHRALPNLDLFRRSNIGLISISTEGQMSWHYRPKFSHPYLKQLGEKLQNMIAEDLGK